MSLLRVTAACVLALATWGCNKNLAKCEDRIKADLVAPATYETVKANSCKHGMCNIEYDAENAFGVPIRGEGICIIVSDTGEVRWSDTSSL